MSHGAVDIFVGRDLPPFRRESFAERWAAFPHALMAGGAFPNANCSQFLSQTGVDAESFGDLTEWLIS